VRHAFHPEAALEFDEAIRFYKKSGNLLAARFAHEVRTTISKVTLNPERWRVLEDDVRRCLVRVFPYSVLYSIERDYVLIVAVMHGKRRPGYWKQRTAQNPKRPL
jgi:toxin ParE1/3/4